MPSATDTVEVRQAIIEACRWMNQRGINQGTSGNISQRIDGDEMLITPSGVPYDRLTADMMVRMPIDGPIPPQTFKPSTEWRFHQALLRAKPSMQAVVHAHPPHAGAIAIQRRPILACHYMIAAFGGDTVPLAPYHLFGGSVLADAVVDTMAERHGCLMANHGAVVVGETLERALWRLEELEVLARMDIMSRIGGEPHILSAEEIDAVLVEFSGYGPKASQ